MRFFLVEKHCFGTGRMQVAFKTWRRSKLTGRLATRLFQKPYPRGRLTRLFGSAWPQVGGYFYGAAVTCDGPVMKAVAA